MIWKQTNGHIVKLKSDVGKTSSELNSFKLEMDKHLIKQDLKNKANMDLMLSRFQDMENKLENQLKSKFSNEEADAALAKIDSSLNKKQN